MREITLRFPGRPIPASRPRVTNGRWGRRTFYEEPYNSRRKELKSLAMSEIRKAGFRMAGERALVSVAITCFFKPPRKYMVGAYCGAHVGDCDNHAKSILDALNGAAFVDDRSVVLLAVAKQYGAWKTPSTEETIVTVKVLAESFP